MQALTAGLTASEAGRDFTILLWIAARHHFAFPVCMHKIETHSHGPGTPPLWIPVPNDILSQSAHVSHVRPEETPMLRSHPRTSYSLSIPDRNPKRACL